MLDENFIVWNIRGQVKCESKIESKDKIKYKGKVKCKGKIEYKGKVKLLLSSKSTLNNFSIVMIYYTTDIEITKILQPLI